jgi:hypothetical protein
MIESKQMAAEIRNNQNTETPVAPQFIATEYGLSVAQDQWISYCAVGGLITDETGTMRKMKLDEFCTTFKTPERTLYSWKQTIPDFAMKVRERRVKLFPSSRETNLWNRAYLIAMTTTGPQAIEAIKLLAGQFAGWQPPSQKVEHELGSSFMDLLQANRMKQKTPQLAESTVIDATVDNSSQTNA